MQEMLKIHQASQHKRIRHQTNQLRSQHPTSQLRRGVTQREKQMDTEHPHKKVSRWTREEYTKALAVHICLDLGVLEVLQLLLLKTKEEKHLKSLLQEFQS